MKRLELIMVKKTEKADAIFPREKAKALALAIGQAKTAKDCQKLIIESIDGLPINGPGSSWFQAGSRIVKWLNRPTRNKIPYTVFARGNGKLPFFAFSALPFATCPGMGDCESFCYSPRSWRVAPPFFRQVQNTILARFFPGLIGIKFFQLEKNVVLRLFVDGDFHNEKSVEFWMNALKIRADIRAYGYSKSWNELINYSKNGGIFPKNYILNLSSGGKNRGISKEDMQKLPIVRGSFVAVPIDGKHLKGGNKRYARKNYHDAVRESAKNLGYSKVFSCPGKCGSCIKGPNGLGYSHACGDKRFQNVAIVNGVH